MILHSYMFALLMWLALLLKTFPKKCSSRLSNLSRLWVVRYIHKRFHPITPTGSHLASPSTFMCVCWILSQPFQAFFKAAEAFQNLPNKANFVSGWWVFQDVIWRWWIRHPLGKLVPGSHRTIHGKLPRCLYKSNHWIVPLTSTTVPLLQGKEFWNPSGFKINRVFEFFFFDYFGGEAQ